MVISYVIQTDMNSFPGIPYNVRKLCGTKIKTFSKPSHFPTTRKEEEKRKEKLSVFRTFFSHSFIFFF